MNLFDTDRGLLDGALAAVLTRGRWSPFPEVPSPKVRSEHAKAEHRAAIASLVGADYPLHQPCERALVATEQSPYGERLDRRARVALSVNLTKCVFVNQSAAFSDFHATGRNRANASFISTAFVADSFVVVQRRAQVTA